MKKLSVLLMSACFAVLSGISLSAQDMQIVTRAELSNDEDIWSNSSVYFLCDGTLSRSFSYSVSTHLLSSDPTDLYTGFFDTASSSWLDWAYITFDMGNFTLDAGKINVPIKTFELERYDFDNYYELTTAGWNATYTYQWGTALNFQPMDNLALSCALTTSPLPNSFSFGIGSDFSIGELYEGKLSLSRYFAGDDSINLFTSGHKFKTGLCDLFLDTYVYGSELYSINLFSDFQISDQWMVRASLSSEKDGVDFVKAGLLVNWNPFESLRVHSLCSYSTALNSVLFNIGATWTISL